MYLITLPSAVFTFCVTSYFLGWMLNQSNQHLDAGMDKPAPGCWDEQTSTGCWLAVSLCFPQVSLPENLL
jgi:hypothetical protein